MLPICNITERFIFVNYAKTNMHVSLGSIEQWPVTRFSAEEIARIERALDLNTIKKYGKQILLR